VTHGAEDDGETGANSYDARRGDLTPQLSSTCGYIPKKVSRISKLGVTVPQGERIPRVPGCWVEPYDKIVTGPLLPGDAEIV
jgi:hypothetical protein